MEIVIKILQFIACFSILVIIHELGHFLFAKMFGVRVEKFYLFFNPWFSIAKFRIGETEYGIGWIPFGGYVKLSGMIDESMDTEQMKEPVKPYELRSKPAWQRLLIMAGGVLMNVVLALAVYVGMSYKWGDSYIANDDLRYGYAFSSLGHEMGFRNGDRIVSIDGEKIDKWQDAHLRMLLDESPVVEVLRDGEKLNITVGGEYVSRIIGDKNLMVPRHPFVIGKLAEGMPAEKAGLQSGDSLVAFNGVDLLFYDEYIKMFTENKGLPAAITVSRDSAGIVIQHTYVINISEEGTIGVMPYGESRFMPVRTHHYSFLQSLPVGIKRTGTEISMYWKQIKLMFRPETEAYKSLGGPLTMGSLFPGSWDWYAFWRITAFFSIALAVINILPIPGLDGGHILFLMFEAITRRKPSDKFMEYAITFGTLLLIALIIFATWNDIYRLFIK